MWEPRSPCKGASHRVVTAVSTSEVLYIYNLLAPLIQYFGGACTIDPKALEDTGNKIMPLWFKSCKISNRTLRKFWVLGLFVLAPLFHKFSIYFQNFHFYKAWACHIGASAIKMYHWVLVQLLLWVFLGVTSLMLVHLGLGFLLGFQIDIYFPS